MWSFQRIGPKKLKETIAAIAAIAAIAEEWNVKDRPYQALS